MSTDNLSREQRSKAMHSVKSKGSKIEQKLKNELWKRGYRYRKNVKSIYGKPDIAFIKLRIAIFCDSEFWHGYEWEKRKYEIKSNREFWWPKIEHTIERDIEVTSKLKEDGWIVLRFWGYEIMNDISKCVEETEKTIHSRESNRNTL